MGEVQKLCQRDEEIEERRAKAIYTYDARRKKWER
jgi:hypothetical protein